MNSRQIACLFLFAFLGACSAEKKNTLSFVLSPEDPGAADPADPKEYLESEKESPKTPPPGSMSAQQNSPSDGETLKGDKDNQKNTAKTQSLMEKLLGWVNEMGKKFGIVKMEIEEMNSEELVKELNKLGHKYMNGDPSARIRAQTLLETLLDKTGKQYEIRPVSNAQNWEVAVTKKNNNVVGMNVSTKFKTGGNLSAEVDGVIVKEGAEVEADNEIGAGFEVSDDEQSEKSFKAPRMVFEVLFYNKNGVPYKPDIFVYPGPDSIKLRDLDDVGGRGSVIGECKCHGCIALDRMPKGYQCSRMDDCSKNICAEWSPTKPEFTKVYYIHFQDTDRLALVTPELVHADNQIRQVLPDQVSHRMDWLRTSVRELEKKHELLKVRIANYDALVSATLAIVQTQVLDQERAVSLQRKALELQQSSCSFKGFDDLVQAAKSFQSGVVALKPLYEQAVATLAWYGENLPTLEKNWPHWTAGYEELNKVLSYIETTLPENYCVKMKAAMTALSDRIQQEKIRGITSDLNSALDNLESALRETYTANLFNSLNEDAIIQALTLSKSLNRARISGNLISGRKAVNQANHWLQKVASDIRGSELPKDRQTEILQTVDTLLRQRISDWDQMVSKYGEEGIVSYRNLVINKKLQKVRDSFELQDDDRKEVLYRDWRASLEKFGFESAAKCAILEHRSNNYCWRVESQTSIFGNDAYAEVLNRFDFVADKFLLEQQ